MSNPTHADLLRLLSRGHKADCDCKSCVALAEVAKDKADRER